MLTETPHGRSTSSLHGVDSESEEEVVAVKKWKRFKKPIYQDTKELRSPMERVGDAVRRLLGMKTQSTIRTSRIKPWIYVMLLVLRSLCVLLPGYLHPDEHFQSSEVMADDMFSYSGPTYKGMMNMTKYDDYLDNSFYSSQPDGVKKDKYYENYIGFDKKHDTLAWEALWHGGYRTWEFDYRFPSRSMVQTFLISGIPFLLVKLIRISMLSFIFLLSSLAKLLAGVDSQIFGSSKSYAYVLASATNLPIHPTVLWLSPRLWCLLLSFISDNLILSVSRSLGSRGWDVLLITSSSWVSIPRDIYLYIYIYRFVETHR